MQKKRRISISAVSRVTGFSVALLLLIPALATPAFAEPASTSWIECDPASTPACPTSPKLTSVTSDTNQMFASWSWGEDTPIPASATALLLRVSPGEHEIIVATSETSASIQGLDSGTRYSVTVIAAAGSQLGVPSESMTTTTLIAGAFKPQATSGNVDSLIVTLATAQSTESVVANASSELPIAGVTVADTQDLGAGNARIELSKGISDSDAQAMIADLEADPRIESVEVDRRVFGEAFPTTPPDDTNWANNSLWGLYGTYGVGIASSNSTMNSIWTNNQGAGSVVAVLDTGSTVHPDLDANYIAGYDFVQASSPSCRTGASSSDGDYVSTGTYGALGWDSNPLDPGDWTNISSADCGAAASSSWHGTHVAGTIAAVANNNQYIAGVAPLAKIQPVRVLSFEGGSESDIIAAITWASGGSISGVPNNSTPADVINMSLGGSGSCSVSTQTAINAAVGRGTVVVVSAGNNDADASGFFPANCNNVITVAALTSAGARAGYSNYGATVEIAAPGSGIYSTVNTGATTPVGPTVASYNGTSMAAPHVAGVAALLKSQNDSITPAQVLTRIQSTATAFPTVSAPALSCTTSICGAGVLQASALNLPNVSSILPISGPTAGGTSVTITGLNLTSPTSVTFGGTAGTVTASSATSITVTSPARSAGAVSVAVTTSVGTSSTESGFTYADQPTISTITPVSGTAAGGTAVTISGTNLSSPTSVTFGGTSATVSASTSTSITVVTPAGSAGAVAVAVTTLGGTVSRSSGFTYTAVPSGGGGGGGGGGSSPSSDTGSGGGTSAAPDEISVTQPVVTSNQVSRPGEFSVVDSTGAPVALQSAGLVPSGFSIQGADWGVTGNGALNSTNQNLTPGNNITISGEGLQRLTTVGVYILSEPTWVGSGIVGYDNKFTTSFSIPALPPGQHTLQINVVRKSGVANSLAVGFALTGVAAPTTQTTAVDLGNLIGFRSESAALSKSAQTKLSRMANAVKGSPTSGSITAYYDARGTVKSKALAKTRAANIAAYLGKSGVSPSITVVLRPANTAALQRSALTRLTTSATSSTNGEQISSLIVRYKAGVSPTVNGAVRGANAVTGGLGSGMTLGPNLGLRMYRIDFAQPVNFATAQKAAGQLSGAPGVEFAEPDRLVAGTVSTRTSTK